MTLTQLSIEQLIRCYVSQTEPIVQADHPYETRNWRDWLAVRGYTVEDIGEELDRRR